MLRRLNQLLAGARPATIVIVSLAGLLVVAWADYRTGPEIEVAVFYLPWIGAAAWYLGRRFGIGFAVIAAFASMATDWFLGGPRPELQTVLLNGTARFLFFLFAAGMISLVGRQNSRFSVMAREDPLTGIPNRRAFFEELERALEWGRRHDTPLVLAYIDLDDFKRINDGIGGHADGDQVLITVARALRDGTRKVDVVARLGGDEFAVILPETDSRQAERVIEHVMALVRQRMEKELPGKRITMSVGVVTFQVPPASVDTAVALADACMYGVKQLGKNQVAFRAWP